MAETCLKAWRRCHRTQTVQASRRSRPVSPDVEERRQGSRCPTGLRLERGRRCTGCGACEVTSADDLIFKGLAKDDLNDGYYKVDRKFLAECEEFYGHAVARMLAGYPAVVLAHPLSVYPPGNPRVKLVGKDGNAFAVMGACRVAARNAGWSDEQIKGVLDEMQAGDYNHLLATACKYFEVS